MKDPLPTEMRLALDQTLWYVPSARRGTPHEVKVKGLGRKWATLDNGERISMSTLHADGGQYVSPGRAWFSKEDWETAVALQNAWVAFRARVDRSWSVPEGVTASQIENAIRALFKGEP